jgi:ribonuclease HII
LPGNIHFAWVLLLFFCCSAVVDRETIDEINILQAAMLAMQRAVEGLRSTPDAVLIDGNRWVVLLLGVRPAAAFGVGLCFGG